MIAIMMNKALIVLTTVANQQTNLREEKGCTTVNQPICTPDYEDVCRDYEVEVRPLPRRNSSEYVIRSILRIDKLQG